MMTPAEVLHALAERFKTRRLDFGWSREEVGRRAGIAVPTLRRFETTGQISLARLLQLAMALDLLKEFEALATSRPEPRSLKELEATWTKPIRQRGRTIKRNRSMP